MVVPSGDLLAAERILFNLSRQMADEYQKGGSKWPLDWMQKHIDDRAAIIKVREFLIDRADSVPDSANK